MSSHTLKTYIGDDCPVVVEYDYQPRERMTLEYPGCSEGVEVESVEVNGKEILEELSKKCLDELEEKCLDDIHDQEER